MYEDQQRTRPYGSPAAGRVFLHQFKHGTSGRLTVFALIAGLLGLALGAASLAFFLSYKSSAETQIHQLQQAAISAQAASQGNARSVTGLAGQVSGMGSTLNGLAAYNQQCSQALVGQNGSPGVYYYPCTNVRP